jgi:hypothetical protein
MSKIENFARPLFEVAAPADKLGGPPSAEQSQLQALVEQINDIPRQGLERDYFESKLRRTNLMSVLEKARIVPPEPENPSPFHPGFDIEKAAYEEWGKAHPQEFQAFYAARNQRTKILDTIYLGAQLRDIIEKPLFATATNPVRLWTKTPSIVDFFKKEYKKRGPVSIDYQLSIMHHPLLPALEQTGIVPVTTRPPHAWITWLPQQKEQWLNHHPAYAERGSKLQHLYMGMIVNETIDRLEST